MPWTLPRDLYPNAPVLTGPLFKPELPAVWEKPAGLLPMQQLAAGSGRVPPTLWLPACVRWENSWLEREAWIATCRSTLPNPPCASHCTDPVKSGREVIPCRLLVLKQGSIWFCFGEWALSSWERKGEKIAFQREVRAVLDWILH